MTVNEIADQLEGFARMGVMLKPEECSKLANALRHLENPDDKTANLGQVFYLTGDKQFKAVCTAMDIKYGGVITYKLEWRDGRSFQEKWLSAAELTALDKLED